jgi:hypothetical protein
VGEILIQEPAIGNVIVRNNVGAWLLQNAVRNGLKEENPYLGKIMTITTYRIQIKGTRQ